MKKVLVITYYWPPSGGSGVQRWLKFIKYIHGKDIDAHILTVSPHTASYPITDESLLKEVPDGLKVFYADSKEPFEIYQKVTHKNIPKSGFSGEKKPSLSDKFFRFIRGNFFIPDARKGWNKQAYIKAKKLIESFNIDTVITSSPPHSTQLIGLKLKKELRIKWICDLRDPWTDLFYNESLYQTSIAKRIDSNYEKSCLLTADQIVVVSDYIKSQISIKYTTASSKIKVIPNGYDPEDFSDMKKVRSEKKYISYVGNLGENYPIKLFLKSFQKLNTIDDSWKLRFVGNVSEQTTNTINEMKLNDVVELLPYQPHIEAVKTMLNSDVLLLIIPEIRENKGILTGKLFEYIATENPIILIGPKDGNAAQILSEFNNCSIHNYNEKINLEEIVNTLDSVLPSSRIKSKYSRAKQAQEIIDLIQQ